MSHNYVMVWLDRMPLLWSRIPSQREKGDKWLYKHFKMTLWKVESLMNQVRLTFKKPRPTKYIKKKPAFYDFF